jgi:hypothetical protein
MVLHEVIVGFCRLLACCSVGVACSSGCRYYIWDIGCSVFILIVVLICCYFSGVVWWALVAAVAEYRYFGELFFLKMS